MSLLGKATVGWTVALTMIATCCATAGLGWLASFVSGVLLGTVCLPAVLVYSAMLLGLPEAEEIISMFRENE